MASIVFNQGKALALDSLFRGTAVAGGNFRLYLYDNGGAPAAEDLDLDDVTALNATAAAEATGGGYGELTIAQNSTDFDFLSVNDTNNRGEVQMLDKSWTAVTTSITGVYYAILTDGNVTEGSRKLLVSWDLVGPHTITANSTLTIQDAEVRIT